MATLFYIATFFWGEDLINLITTSQEVREEAAKYLPLTAATGLTGVLAFQMNGIYLGATWSSMLRDMMILSFGIYVVALFVLGYLFDNYGLWIALHVFLMMRGVSLLMAFPRLRIATFGNK